MSDRTDEIRELISEMETTDPEQFIDRLMRALEVIVRILDDHTENFAAVRKGELCE